MHIFLSVQYAIIFSVFTTFITGFSMVIEETDGEDIDRINKGLPTAPTHLDPKCKNHRCARQVTSNIEKKPFGMSDKGRCECALFSVNDVGPESKPVVSKETIEVHCTKEGQDTCEKLCVEIAKAAQNQGPIIVCDAAKDVQNLIMRLYTRVCSSKDWNYSGIESTDELCCENGLPVKCGNHNVPLSLAIAQGS